MPSIFRKCGLMPGPAPLSYGSHAICLIYLIQAKGLYGKWGPLRVHVLFLLLHTWREATQFKRNLGTVLWSAVDTHDGL